MTGPLCGRLTALCLEAERRLNRGRARDAVAAVRERLAEHTLRVAVGGRVNAGKSTLVNALLGQRLAATGATETTRIVAWYRHHHQNRIEVHPRDGAPYYVAAARGGGLPERPGALGRPAEEIASVAVEVSNAALAERHTLIDTPGLDSTSALDQTSLEALRQADAVVYVMPHPGEGDAAALEAVRSWAGSLGLTAANVIGVLSRIDELGDATGDPWPEARRIADSYAGAELRGLVSRVVPVAGLVAEAACGSEFSEADTRALAWIAAADPDEREFALDSPDDFRDWHDAPVDAPTRERLLRLLGRYGIREAVGFAAAGITHTPALLDRLRRRSGIEVLLAHIEHDFVRGADRLRAAAATASLDEATWHGQDADEQRTLAALRDGLDELRRDPMMRQVALTRALADLSTGAFALGDDDYARLVALATGRDAAACLGLTAPPIASSPTPPADAAPLPDKRLAADIAAAADRQIDRWRVLEASPEPMLARHARTARELCEAWYFQHA